MIQHAFQIGPIPFDTAVSPGAGDGTLILPLPLIDLSRCYELSVQIKITDAAVAVDDTLDAKLQKTFDGEIWDTVARFPAFAGDLTLTTPEAYIMDLQNHIALQSSGEMAYEPSDSDSATEITADTVRNGLFPGKVYLNGVQVPAWRFVLEIADPDSDAQFVGEFSLWCK